jgi:DNA helicase HerA-like ATPase
MTKLQPVLVGKSETSVYLYPQMANRHGLIAEASGTGKTITLKVLAESFSRMGVPVFLADIKGDLGSTAIPGTMNPKIQDRVTK